MYIYSIFFYLGFLAWAVAVTSLIIFFGLRKLVKFLINRCCPELNISDIHLLSPSSYTTSADTDTPQQPRQQAAQQGQHAPAPQPGQQAPAVQPAQQAPAPQQGQHAPAPQQGPTTRSKTARKKLMFESQ